MISRAAVGLVLALVVLGPACGRRGSPFAEGGGASSEVEVVGPASLRVEGRLVRLAGVSLPQAAPQAGCWAEGLLAREAMEVLQAETDYVRDLEIRAAPGSPGRSIVLVHGRDLSRLLIERGFAARTDEDWDWCGPLTPVGPKAPRLGYSARSAAAAPEVRLDPVQRGQEEEP